MYTNKIKSWLSSNGTPEYLSCVRNKIGSTRETLKRLGISEESEIGVFYLNYGSFCVRGWYELNEIEDIEDWTNYAHEALEVPIQYIALTGIEGQGITLINRHTNEVYDVEYGKFEDFKEGKLKPIASSFCGYLEWCMNKNEESA